MYTQIFPEKTEFCIAILFTEAIITPVSWCHDQVWSGCFSPFHGDHVKGNSSLVFVISLLSSMNVFRVETYLQSPLCYVTVLPVLALFSRPTLLVMFFCQCRCFFPTNNTVLCCLLQWLSFEFKHIYNHLFAMSLCYMLQIFNFNPSFWFIEFSLILDFLLKCDGGP